MTFDGREDYIINLIMKSKLITSNDFSWGYTASITFPSTI